MKGQVKMDKSIIRENQRIEGSFRYQDKHYRVTISDIDDQSEDYSYNMTLLGFKVVDCIASDNGGVSWILTLPNSSSPISFTAADLSNGQNIEFVFSLETYNNALTQEQAKWIMNYLMEAIIYQEKQSKSGFQKRILENEICHNDFMWDEY